MINDVFDLNIKIKHEERPDLKNRCKINNYKEYNQKNYYKQLLELRNYMYKNMTIYEGVYDGL